MRNFLKVMLAARSRATLPVCQVRECGLDRFKVERVVDPVFDAEIGWKWGKVGDEQVVKIYECPLDADLLEARQEAMGLSGLRDSRLSYIDDEHFIVVGPRHCPYLFGTYLTEDLEV